MRINQIDRGLSNKTEHCTKKYGHTVETHLPFYFFSLWNLEYQVDPSSPETSIHNEWLVNLMYATVESCSACSRPCLRLRWDHNEAIFLTDFSTCWSSDASEPLVYLSASSSVVALAVQPRWWRNHLARLSVSPPLRRPRSFLTFLIRREVFLFISNTLPQMTLLKATFKNVFNYLYLTNAFFFCSAPPAPPLDGVSLYPMRLLWLTYR